MSLENSLPAAARSRAPLARGTLIALISFFTLVDLFAAQAVLPTLVQAYGVSPAEMGVAVNASTFGMAVAGVVVALISRRLDRRRGIWISLALLSVPTALLSVAPDLASFTALRIVQGLFMSTAFTLTMAYLAERCSAEDAAGALAAYITGNVASNLFGRMMAASLADMLGLAANFQVFALMNLAGALLVFLALERTPPMPGGTLARSALAAWRAHLSDPALAAAFAIGFLILFAFLGTFTYVNFELAGPQIGLGAMSLGLVYLVFVPSILTTPLAGHATRRFGTRPTFWGALAVAGVGLPLLLLGQLAAMLAGLVLVGIGTFFAQATATGYVSRAAASDRAAASGIYLASYYVGGLAGAALLGRLYEGLGWAACVAGIAAALLLAAVLASRLVVQDPAT